MVPRSTSPISLTQHKVQPRRSRTESNRQVHGLTGTWRKTQGHLAKPSRAAAMVVDKRSWSWRAASIADHQCNAQQVFRRALRFYQPEVQYAYPQ